MKVSKSMMGIITMTSSVSPPIQAEIIDFYLSQQQQPVGTYNVPWAIVGNTRVLIFQAYWNVL